MEFPELSVLAVDDEDLFLKFLHNLVTKEFNSQFYSAKTPKKALEILEKIKPSLIILDMQMPVMDGFTLLTILRKNKELKDIPVVACSSLRHRNLIIGLAELGIMDYIVKTDKREVYLERIGKVLKKIKEKQEGFLEF